MPHVHRTRGDVCSVFARSLVAVTVIHNSVMQVTFQNQPIKTWPAHALILPALASVSLSSFPSSNSSLTYCPELTCIILLISYPSCVASPSLYCALLYLFSCFVLFIAAILPVLLLARRDFQLIKASISEIRHVHTGLSPVHLKHCHVVPLMSIVCHSR